MNCILTEKVILRGKEVLVCDLKSSANVRVEVECRHGRRMVRWDRRNQWCHKCRAEAGHYNTSTKGRQITWGDKISSAKKGKKFTKEHKAALLEARAVKRCQRANIPREQFAGFPCKGERLILRNRIMARLRKNMVHHTVEEQDNLIWDRLGYTIEELRAHLEGLFHDGMSWDNCDLWDIDHVRPDSWFEYSSIEDSAFRESFALSNLQPMWSAQNKKKNNLYSGAYREPVIYLLCGQSGVGKTTVARQLTHKFTVVSFDDLKTQELTSFLRKNWHNDKPILLDIPVHISTTIRRYSQKYQIVAFFIIEPPEIVRERIISRGGNRLENVENRYARMVTLAQQYSSYTGKAEDVLKYLMDYTLERNDVEKATRN